MEVLNLFWNAINDIGYLDSDLDINDFIDETYYKAAMEQLLKGNSDNAFYSKIANGGYGSNAE